MIIRHNTPTGHVETETWYADGQQFKEVRTYDRDGEWLTHDIQLQSDDLSCALIEIGQRIRL